MKTQSWWLLTIIMICATNAFCSIDRPNEPPGSTFLSENAFNAKPASSSQIPGTWWDIYPTGNAQIISDATAPKSPSNVLQQKRPPNSTGGTVIGYSFPQPRKEVYAAFWWKPSDPFYGWNNNTQKVASIQPSMNMFFMWFGARTAPRTTGVLLQTSTVDNQQAGCPYANSSCNFYSNMSSGVVLGGQWHLIEWYVKQSDTPTSQNGILRWWVDRELAGNYTNINMATLPYTDFRFSHTWDGGDPNQPTTDYHWFDHAYISAPNGAPSILMINTGTLPTARTGTPYTATLAASGGQTPYTWMLESGSLPAGLTLSSAGKISGTPTTVGKSTFAIRVTDSHQPALTAVKSYSIVTSGTSIVNAASTKAAGIAVTTKGAADRVIFDLQFAKAGKFSLKAFDLQGRSVWNYSASAENGSSAKAVWNHGGNLKKGVYVIRAEQNGKAIYSTSCHVQ